MSEYTNSQRIGIAVFIIAASATVIYYFYKQGKNSALVNQANLPPDLSPSGGTDSNANLSQIAQRMNADMSGLNILGWHDEVPYEDALALSNTDFVQLYNIYNALYQKDSGQTLTQWINAESYQPLSAWQAVQQAMIQRLTSLNLP